MLESNKLLETQCEDLLRELVSILKEKWPLTNQTGEVYIKTIFNCFTDLFNENDETTTKKSDINFKQLQLINECNLMFSKLNDLLKTFKQYIDRINKINSNLIYIIDLNLEAHKLVSKNEFKQLINDINDSVQKEFYVKSDLIGQYIREARFNQETQVGLMACWIHEAFISYDIYLFKLKTILESIK